MPSFVDSMGAKYSLLIPESLKQVINSLNEEGGDKYKAKKALEQAIAKLAALVTLRPGFGSDSEDAEMFVSGVKKALPELEGADLSSLIDLVEESARLRELNFIYTKHGFTLMKWYNLTNKTARKIISRYEEFDYQNSTGGPSLSEFCPAMDSVINERVKDFIKHDLESTACLDGVNAEEAVKVIREITGLIKDATANHLYKERDYVWDDALGGALNYAEAGLSFSLYTGWEFKMHRWCYLALYQACKPVAEQNQRELAFAIKAKEKNDAWVQRLMAKRDSNAQG